MKPWEHPKVREALGKLEKQGEEERTMDTPEGPRRFRITHYRDPEGNEVLEIRGVETGDYILIPKKTLGQILREAGERDQHKNTGE